jgi:hypothetical protein
MESLRVSRQDAFINQRGRTGILVGQQSALLHFPGNKICGSHPFKPFDVRVDFLACRTAACSVPITLHRSKALRELKDRHAIFAPSIGAIY